MLLLISSIILGYIGFSIGGTLQLADFWSISFGLIGFTAPYAYILEKIYKRLYKE
ncbi:MAG TPA: hypothetical protein VEB00_05600 [Clostridia bacterium]|nr:hypothetical protein [Clostridia bacterium]